jgi:heme/copper-type cytochrome/quinol oxidase subunit 1
MAAKGFLITATILALTASVTRSLSGGLDLQLHNTYFVFAPRLVLLGMASLAALFAVIYYFVPMSARVSKIHFWLTVTSLSGFWISFYVFGYLIRTISGHAEMPGAVSALAAFAVSAAVLAASPAIFVFNLVVALLSRYRLAH